MKIKIFKKYRGLRAGETFSITPNTLNYWVGNNGTGKTALTSLILSLLQLKDRKLVPKHAWKATSLNAKEVGEISGFDNISGLTLFSAALRQTQFVDMTSLIDMGLGRIWASEGQNSQEDLKEVIKNATKRNHIFILDELDGHLDYQNKILYFDYILPRLAGTAIVVTHDPLFIKDRQVFDFNDRCVKMGSSYYNDMRGQIVAMERAERAKREEAAKDAHVKQDKIALL